jgi:hypothetical protein
MTSRRKVDSKRPLYDTPGCNRPKDISPQKVTPDQVGARIVIRNKVSRTRRCDH